MGNWTPLDIGMVSVGELYLQTILDIIQEYQTEKFEQRSSKFKLSNSNFVKNIWKYTKKHY